MAKLTRAGKASYRVTLADACLNNVGKMVSAGTPWFGKPLTRFFFLVNLQSSTYINTGVRTMKKECFKGPFCSKQGFTLIELLVVVLIIGILVAVAVPQYKKAVIKSKLATLKSLVSTVANAAEIYYLAHGIYPKQLSELDIDIPVPNNTQYDEDQLTDLVTYPWGICYLRSTSNKLFQCNNLQVNIGYIQRFVRSPNLPRMRACSALNNTTDAIAVCQQETGKSSYYYQGDDGHGNMVESYLY